MGSFVSREESQRITARLRQAAELTELCLALRKAVVRRDFPHEDADARVMREIRLAKERAWQQNRS
ncbi:MAG: hypothetical protein D6690_01780 [Nitrospirae bacterium]|nr:MAG: hypothetical protein D6690_01780 [Nitrospirota bacterium]